MKINQSSSLNFYYMRIRLRFGEKKTFRNILKKKNASKSFYYYYYFIPYFLKIGSLSAESTYIIIYNVHVKLFLWQSITRIGLCMAQKAVQQKFNLQYRNSACWHFSSVKLKHHHVDFFYNKIIFHMNFNINIMMCFISME